MTKYPHKSYTSLPLRLEYHNVPLAVSGYDIKPDNCLEIPKSDSLRLSLESTRILSGFKS